MLSVDGLQNCPGACVQKRCVVRVAPAAVLPVWWLSLTSGVWSCQPQPVAFHFAGLLIIEFFEEVTI